MIPLVLAIALLVSRAAPASAQQVTAVVTEASPVFLVPDASRTPLATLTAGTLVRVLREERGWYRIEFRDSRFGLRIGYIEAGRVRVQPASKPPVPASPPTQQADPRRPQPVARRAIRRRSPPVLQRAFISINAGLQTSSRAFSSTTARTQFVEEGSLSASYSGDDPLVFDASATAGVWRALGIGVAAVYASKPVGGVVTVKAPHPFFFNRPRTVVGSVPDLTRQEIGIHMSASWMLRLTRSTSTSFFGGPSYFKVTQALVTDVSIEETYPFDTASFGGSTTAEVRQDRWGYHVGLDISQRLGRHIGVGVLARYSRAQLQFPINSTEVDAKAGGLQLGIGGRLFF